MNTKTNRYGETTSLTHANALAKAEYEARYRHGEWFAWQHKSGEWYVASRANVSSVEDAALNVNPSSRVYLIGGGGPHSMVFSRFSANILPIWERSVRVGY